MFCKCVFGCVFFGVAGLLCITCVWFCLLVMWLFWVLYGVVMLFVVCIVVFAGCSVYWCYLFVVSLGYFVCWIGFDLASD